LATVEHNRANIFSNLNQIKKAKQLYDRAASIYHQIEWHVAENKSHYALAFILFLEDKFTDAIKLFEQVYEKSKQLADPVGAAMTLLDMAEINIQLNQFGSAIMLTDQIIPEFHRLGQQY